VREILDLLPQFSLENRKGLLQKKIDYIKNESGRDRVYMKGFIKRHPDIVMKSYASLDAKINYLSRNLNRPLKQEKNFPMVLHYNYNRVIRPRGDLLKQKLGVKPFDLHQAFGHSDKKFCDFWGISMEALKKAKA
jgi:hypothetical protein